MRIFKTLNFMLFMCHSSLSFALTPLNEKELSQSFGQAFITIDASSYSDGLGEFAGDYEFTKVNFGADIETLLNIDELRIGEFDRNYDDGDVGASAYYENPDFDSGDPGSVRYLPVRDDNGDVIIADADIIIKNFGLGRVDRFRSDNPEIVPFNIRDPFIEIAYKVNGNGVKEIAGFRLGFGGVKGDLSGDLLTLTGNIEGEITGVAGTAYEALDCANGFGDHFIECSAAGLDPGLELRGPVSIIDPETGLNNRNGTYLKRASWLGVAENTSLTSDDDALDIIPADWLVEFLAASENCKTFGLDSCFKATQYQSVYIGDVNEEDGFKGLAEGIFISLQAQSVPWENLSGVGEDRILTERRAFINIARFRTELGEIRYPINLDLYNALAGEQRVPTCIGKLKGC